MNSVWIPGLNDVFKGGSHSIARYKWWLVVR